MDQVTTTVMSQGTTRVTQHQCSLHKRKRQTSGELWLTCFLQARARREMGHSVSLQGKGLQLVWDTAQQTLAEASWETRIRQTALPYEKCSRSIVTTIKSL